MNKQAIVSIVKPLTIGILGGIAGFVSFVLLSSRVGFSIDWIEANIVQGTISCALIIFAITSRRK